MEQQPGHWSVELLCVWMNHHGVMIRFVEGVRSGSYEMMGLTCHVRLRQPAFAQTLPAWPG
jgi:hypothetical protein